MRAPAESRRFHLRSGLALAVFAAAASTASAQSICFEAAFTADTSDSLGNVATGDVDLDGDVDLVVVRGSTVRVLLNQGSATFALGGEYHAGGPGLLALGDLDGDGAPEIAITIPTTNHVAVLRNLGGGSYALPVSYPVQTGPGHVAIADLDGSGRADLVVVNGTASSFTPLMNQGNGTFASGPNYSTAANPSGLAVVDVNGDAKLDVVVTSLTADSLSIYWGNGNGSFTAPVHVPAGNEANRPLAGDLNGDGRIDFVVANLTSSFGFSVLLQLPGGTFTAPAPNTLTGCGHAPLVLRDFDLDGALDVVTTDGCNVAVIAVRGNGDGTFDVPGVRLDSGTDAPHTLTAADLDQDGDLDLVSVRNEPGVGGFAEVRRNCTTSGVSYCSGDGSGTACPCGNASAAGANVGCLNTLGVGGRLRASGSATLSLDELVLSGAQMPNAAALYFQGTARTGGGAGAAFGDGLVCAGGSVIRLGTKTNAGGASSYPGALDMPVSVRGAVAAPGLRHYQTWYRNAAPFCTPSGFNLTNGTSVLWRL